MVPWFHSAALWRNVEAIAALLAMRVVDTVPLPGEADAPGGVLPPREPVPPDALVLTDQKTLPPELEDAPRITVTFAGSAQGDADIVLPGQEKDLLLALEAFRGADFNSTLYLLGFWSPVGTPGEVARKVSETVNAALVDVSGTRLPWKPPQGSVTWEGLVEQGNAASVASLRAALPVWEGVPTLTSDGTRPMRAVNPLAGRVAAGLAGDVVLDCGADIDALVEVASHVNALRTRTQIVLVGDTSPTSTKVLSSCLAALGEALAPAGTCLLVSGKPGPLLWSAVADRSVNLMRLPTGSKRGWAKVGRCLRPPPSTDRFSSQQQGGWQEC